SGPSEPSPHPRPPIPAPQPRHPPDPGPASPRSRPGPASIPARPRSGPAPRLRGRASGAGEMVPELEKATVRIRQPERVRDIIRSLREQGVAKLQL
ncbi:hypothetical protein IHE44_0010276, partial [Lamprotornis superbus]